MFEIFNSKARMTDSIIMILMIMVRMNVKCEIILVLVMDIN